MTVPDNLQTIVTRLRDALRERAATISLSHKRALFVAFDVVMLSFSVWLALTLRLGYWVTPSIYQWAAIVLAPIVAIPFFIRMGLYRAVIRYLPERAIWTIAMAVVLATLTWTTLIFVLEITRLTLIPRSITLIYGMLAIVFVGGSRFALKYVLHGPEPDDIGKRDLILYGAGRTGAVIADALRRERSANVVAFVDDDADLRNRDVAGVRVYPAADLARVMDEMRTTEVVLCMPSISSARRAEIVAILTGLQAKVRVVPPVTDLATGRYVISQMREIDIDDLLGRSAVPPNEELMGETIDGRSILVTGGGGSIGSELCRLFAKWRPRELVILEQSEFALYQIDRQLRQTTDVPIVPVLGSITDERLVKRLFREHAIQLVFHAAAHKHVPMLEINSLEGIRNNVFGTKTLATAAFEAGVERFVLISSDKAVHPTNVMGATKRVAEMIVRDLADKSAALGREQKFCAVRFGNVLGSNGSVVPLFREQIATGGPVTLTDDGMTRYFMSIHEAAELIVQAGGLSRGGDVFVLDMGEPVRIRSLAEQMIRLAGLTVRDEANPGGDIAITVVGKRPGEKLFEELFYDRSKVTPTRQPKILRSDSFESPRTSSRITRDLDPIVQALEAQDTAAAQRLLFELVDENGAPDRQQADVVPLSSARRPT